MDYFSPYIFGRSERLIMRISTIPKGKETEVSELLLNGIYAEAKKAKSMNEILSFGFIVNDDKEQIIGGITGFTFYGNHHIDMLWIHPDFRNLGLGSLLIHHAEQLGAERESKFITVSTMDWEALSFYQNLGFEIEFERKGYEKDSKAYFLKKNYTN